MHYLREIQRSGAKAGLALAAVFFFAGIAGCDEPEVRDEPRPPVSDEAERAPEAPPPPEVPPTRTEPVSPPELFGMEVEAWDYRVTEGRREGDVVRVDLEYVGDDEDLPYRRHRVDGRVEHLAIGEDGSILLGFVEDPGHGVTTRYDPPLTLIPPELPPGSPRSFESTMEVRNIDPPHRRRGRGTATRTVEYVGDETIESPAGDFQAMRIKASYRGEMTLATVTIDATEWYSPGVGLVAEEVDERVRAALIFGETMQQSIRLEALPEHDQRLSERP